MVKLRHAKPGTIATRVARLLDPFLTQRSLDLSVVRETPTVGGLLLPKRQDPASSACQNPAYSLYARVMNQVSYLSEALTESEEFDAISGIVARAEDTYMPYGSSMGPVTAMVFNSWALFDCGVGPERETVGSVILELRNGLELHADVAHVLEKWQASRMGLFELEKTTGSSVTLRELVIGTRLEAINPTGYHGTVGSVWYARVMPPPTGDCQDHVIVTTPYEIVSPRTRGWMSFLERTLSSAKIGDLAQAYEQLMKWGLGPTYWHEYVFEAFLNSDRDGIRLMGLPDVAESRPNPRANRDGQEPLRKYVLSGRMAAGERD